MKTVNIKVLKKDVSNQINLRNFYFGESAKDGNMVEIATKMQTSEDNDDVLDKFILSACSHLVDVLNTVCIDVSFSTSGEDQSTSLDFTLSVSDLFAESQEEVIKEGIFNYLTNWSIYEWMDLAFPNGAKEFFEKCALIEAGLKSRINKRLKPTAR